MLQYNQEESCLDFYLFNLASRSLQEDFNLVPAEAGRPSGSSQPSVRLAGRGYLHLVTRTDGCASGYGRGNGGTVRLVRTAGDAPDGLDPQATAVTPDARARRTARQ